MTLRVQGDPDKLEQLAGENPDFIKSISERAKAQGLIASSLLRRRRADHGR